MNKNIGKNTSKNLSSGKLLDKAKQSATDALKSASQGGIQKTAEATCDLIGNKIADKITKIQRTEAQHILEKFSNETANIEHDKRISKERYIYISFYKTNQASKFRTKNRVKVNDDWRGTYNTNSQIKFKTTMLKLSLCDYSDA